VTTTVKLEPQQEERLSTEYIVWLTTVNAEGVPAPTPVWFFWTGTEFLVFSRPRAGKLAGIRRNPLISLHFNCTPQGREVLVVTGRARVDEAGPDDQEWAGYLAKYHDGLERLNITTEAFRDDFSTLLRIVPERVRAW
jgi:PPOX class probable F420-dependent enzyme